jgi:hypothetical protein
MFNAKLIIKKFWFFVREIAELIFKSKNSF